jgi:sec-independent protein translocase protein TatB
MASLSGAPRRGVDVFDVSPAEILTLAFIALLVFGPNRLPEMAAKAGRFIRQLRTMAETARADLSEQLGPEFKDLQLSDLQPRNLVRKHLLEGIDDDGSLRKAGTDLRSLGRDITGVGGLGGAAAASGRNGVNRHVQDAYDADEEDSAPTGAPEASAPAPAPFDIDAT